MTPIGTEILHVLLLSVILLVLDGVFLGSLKKYFNHQVRIIQGTDMKMNFIAAGLCYIVIIGCLYKFIIKTNASILDAAILGWSVYLIYELTNKALLTNWSWTTVMIDGVWGGILFGLGTYLYRLLLKLLTKL